MSSKDKLCKINSLLESKLFAVCRLPDGFRVGYQYIRLAVGSDRRYQLSVGLFNVNELENLLKNTL